MRIYLQLQKSLLPFCLDYVLKICLRYNLQRQLKKKEGRNLFSSACDFSDLNFFRHGRTKPKNHFNDIQNHYTVQQQQNTSYKLQQTCYTYAHTSPYITIHYRISAGNSRRVQFIIKFLLFFFSCLIKTPLCGCGLYQDSGQIRIFALFHHSRTPHSALKLYRT